MVVERSHRECVLCGAFFTGRSFLCRTCSARYRRERPSRQLRRQFYEGVDRLYPGWANTYGSYNPPLGLLRVLDRLPRTARILELGCGGGALLRELAARGFHELVGLDLARTALAEARQRQTPASLVLAEAERLPFLDRSFDIVLAADLIEHVDDVEEHLAEVARVLREGGQYLVKTPNRPLAEAYYRLVGLDDYPFWHPSLLSPGELRTVFARHGFTVTFVPQPGLTPAQLRKIPSRFLRRIAQQLPVSCLPVWLRPHLEVVAVLRAKC
uniref:Class I SAM-dependent methyltransferase n=2 Tax=Thermomicrobium roseum TaxID=500 RepID=A0A7C1X6J2_THERO